MGSLKFDFDNTTVIITGGSSGIGRAIALEFAEAGAVVINADQREAPRDEDAEMPTHKRIQENGGKAEFIETDVSEPDQIATAVELTREYGGVDVMINNAGIHITESLLDLTEEQFDDIHDINVKGCFFGCQAAARDMFDRDSSGTIINMASISSTMAKPRQIAYESTKGAIQMITRSAALELAPDIRVNALAPGRITTEFGESSAVEKRRSVEEGDILKRIPMDRAGEPKDLTGAALFLASDRAEYVTGELFYIDGGYQIT